MSKTTLSVSGGKDSTYLIHYCLENGIDVDEYIFYDSELELPVIYDWLDELEKIFNIKIRRIPPKKNFYDLFFRMRKKGKLKGTLKGFPFVITKCWYMREIKSKASTKMFKDDVKLIGYTADENRAINWLKEEKFRYPLVEAGISQKEVLRRVQELDLYPPIYKLLKYYGAKKPRTGCWLCPKASIGWCRLVYNEYPKLWQLLEILETYSPHGWKARTTAKKLGERFAKEIPQKDLTTWIPAQEQKQLDTFFEQKQLEVFLR